MLFFHGFDGFFSPLLSILSLNFSTNEMFRTKILKKQVMKIIDGTKISKDIKLEIKEAVSLMKDKTGHVPGLATVLVGERKDSSTYVRMKKKAALEVGIESFSKTFPEDISQKDLLKAIKELNEDKKVKKKKKIKPIQIGSWNSCSIATSKTYQRRRSTC